MMSRLPYYHEDSGYQYPRRLMTQRSGLMLSDPFSSEPFHLRRHYRPWRHLAAAGSDLISSIMATGDKFEINLDVQQYAPEEITVKTAHGYVVVEGKHEEDDEAGYSCRMFMRQYLLPESAPPESVESRLSSDGVLTITALTKVPEALQGERRVPIAYTGPVRNKFKTQGNILPGPVCMEVKDQSNEQTGAVSMEARDQSIEHTGAVCMEIKDQSNRTEEKKAK